MLSWLTLGLTPPRWVGRVTIIPVACFGRYVRLTWAYRMSWMLVKKCGEEASLCYAFFKITIPLLIHLSLRLTILVDGCRFQGQGWKDRGA